MPNYTLLRRGDKLPAVGVLQKLLNRGGARLTVDGDFGSNTQTAVTNFQRQRHLGQDGAVGQESWPRVSASATLPIMDCIDIFDPSLMNLEARDIQNAGGNPLVIGGASNGVEQAVQMILSASPGNVFLLRFHGHGAPGVAGFSFGQGGAGFGHRADVDPQNLNIMLPILGRLRRIFGPYGCVQFMHCSTGSGANGRSVLTSIANSMGVPVSAGIVTQFGGGPSTFRFEGSTFTAVPGGGTIASWSASRPDFASMTVP
jgi:peptidoglycan hydrolase-like protein with peptidoglycan-binding domain